MGTPSTARTIPPIVSTEWLERNLDNPYLIVVDVRSEEEYAEGHIPRSVNVPFKVPVSAWITMRDDLLLELPPPQELFNVAGRAGITPESLVVVVGKAEPPYRIADPFRVAFTLKYIGVENVAVLNGGFDKWAKEGRRISKEPHVPVAKEFRGKTHDEYLASKDYVLKSIGRAIIVDGRDPDVYFGVRLEPWGPVPGHIPTAKNLPAAWMWTPEGLYRSQEELSKIVEGVVGADREREIIVYCGVGGYASVLWFVLREVLGYKNVKLYDGSWQEWAKDPSTPKSAYRWD